MVDWLGADARAVNNGGEIVGEAKVPAGPVNEIHAFYWSAKTGMVDVGRVGPIPSGTGLMSINERGEAVGTRLDGGGFSHAIFWTAKDGLVDLEPPGAMASSASDINNRGEVVGSYRLATGPFRGFVWSPTTGFVELPGLAPTRPSNAQSINEAGEIAGHSVAPSGRSHAVVWRLRGSP